MTKIKNRTYFLLTGIFIVLLSSNTAFAQKEKSIELTPFEIHITQTRKGIDLVCEEGCTWQKLSFNTPNKYKPQKINQLGMAEVNDTNPANGSDSNFAFTIQKTNEGMSLSGLDGTAWESLVFSIKNGQK